MPGTGMIVGGGKKPRFKYKYEDKIIEQFFYIEKEDKYNLCKKVLLDEKNRIKHVDIYAFYYEELLDTIDIKYYKNSIEILKKYIENFNIFPAKYSGDKYIFYLDKDNRLARKVCYGIVNGEESIDYIEKYYYEDGKYQYFPYLLPPKINIDSMMGQYETLVDKYVF
jgi:hypothetical protein